MRRIIAITLGLAAAGALVGAIVAVLVLTILMVVVGGVRWDGIAVRAALIFGGGLGAVLGPIAAWTLMRRVPLWRAIVETAAGTALGAVTGLVVVRLGGPDLMLAGSLVGFAAAAMRLRRSHRVENPRRV